MTKKICSRTDDLKQDFVVKYNKMAFYQSLFGPIVIFILCISGVLKRPYIRDLWIGLIVSVIMILFLYLCFKFLYVEIKNGEFIYNRLLEGKMRIKLSDIDEARDEVSLDRFKPFMRLTIKPRQETGINEFYIVSYNLERDGYKRLLKVLPMKKSKTKGVVETWIQEEINNSKNSIKSRVVKKRKK